MINTVTGRDIRLMAWNPHNRANSGLMERAWIDPRGQAVMNVGKRLTQLYPPAACFCNDVHTDSHIYYNDGEYLDAETGEPIKDMGEIEKSINNDFRNSNSLCGYDESERYDYSINHALLSDIVNINPTMYNPQNKKR